MPLLLLQNAATLRFANNRVVGARWWTMTHTHYMRKSVRDVLITRIYILVCLFFFGAVGVRSAKFSFIHCCPSERLRTGDLLQLLIIWFKHFTESGREWNAIMQVVSTWAKMATVSYKNNHFFITKNGANCLPTHRPVFN